MGLFSINLLIKKIPGFRSGKWWKSAIALPIYLFSLLIIIALITVDHTSPQPPIINLPNKLPETEADQVTITGLTEPKAKVTAKLNEQELDQIQADEKGSFEIKSNLTSGKNILSVKSVDEVGNESQPTLTEISFTPKKQKARVIQVVDGDTIKIEGGERVRYIGIDTPETVDPNRPIGCYGKEVSGKNKDLVKGKIVYLEKDISERDKYDRLLRYIWLDDLLVNEYLVSEGYARVSTYPPDVKYQNRFLEAERKAREEKKGLWGDICDNWSTESTPTVNQIKNLPTKTVPPPIY